MSSVLKFMLMEIKVPGVHTVFPLAPPTYLEINNQSKHSLEATL